MRDKMKALIIAAGRGERLGNLTENKPKPLLKLLGLTLIERIILTANQAGIDEFLVVTGYLGDKIKAKLGDGKNLKVKIDYIENSDWEKGNGISVLKAKDIIKENFILLMSDHIFDESILTDLKNQEITNDEVMLAIDKNIETNKSIDVDDATKVLVEDGRILDIGKTCSKYNAYDTGIFLCSPAIFSAIEESLQNDDSLSGGIKVLANKGKVKTFDIRDNYWLDVDDKNAFIKAETKLLATLKKTSDGPVSRYLNRPISTRITKFLLRTCITPNLISFFSFILALLGAFFFLFGWIY